MAVFVKNLSDVLTEEDKATIISIIGDGAVNNAIQSATDAQLEAWKSEAQRLTANSYANEAVDVEVKHYTSNGDGTFTSTPQTGIYSSLHYKTKSGDSATASANSASSASSSANTATTKAGEASTSAGQASTSANNAQLRVWEAEAQRLTANSYAIEAEDVEVKHYTSNGDGTFTSTAQTGVYSSLHYKNKASTFNPALYGTLAGVNTWDAEQTFKEIKESVYNLTGTAIDPANGTVQYKILSANVTFTEALEDGQSVTLIIANGSSYTVTFPTMTWYSGAGNTAPVLTTNDCIVFWKVNGTLRGAYVGSST